MTDNKKDDNTATDATTEPKKKKLKLDIDANIVQELTKEELENVAGGAVQPYTTCHCEATKG